MSLEDSISLFSNFQKESKKESKLVKFESFKEKLNLTEEQESILNAKEDVIKITAYAGSGKTFVLEKFAKKNIKKRGLYIAFNKDLKLEAERKFPENVKCLTMHGLAFARFGKNLSHKLNYNFSPNAICEIKEIDKKDELIQEIYLRILYKTIINFTYSKDTHIQKHHLFLDEFKILLKSLEEVNNLSQLQIVKNIKISDLLRDAEILWNNMIDSNNSFPTTHDSYLKLMQLANVKMPYDTILLDEAQDVNPAMLDLFEKQQCKKILTGDPYQSIYQFRKAVDGMSLAYADKNYFLTKSFRFGQVIADVANTFICLRGESKPLFGMEEIESKVMLLSEKEESKLFNELSKYKTKAIITRTNAKMFEEALKYSFLGFKIYFEGGQNLVRFDLIKDLENMKNGYMPNDGFLKSFYLNFNKKGNEAFEALKEFSKENDREWYLRCIIVDKHKDDLNQKIEQLKSNLAIEKEENVMIVTNVHKSKGLEYDAVVLSDDFNQEFLLKNKIEKDKKLDIVKKDLNEDLNLLYVAATRAKSVFYVKEELMFHINNVNYLINKTKLYEENYLSMVNNQFGFNEVKRSVESNLLNVFNKMSLIKNQTTIK